MIRYIYLAGPMTLGDPNRNVHAAMKATTAILHAGGVPFVPQLFTLHAMVDPRVEYDDYLRMDLAWIERCDALVRLPGESRGADREVRHARGRGRVVVTLAGCLELLAGRPYDNEFSIEDAKRWAHEIGR